MAQLEYNQNLVRDQRETARYDCTHKGQASWAIGPHACDGCSFFVDKKRGGGRCGKYRQLMHRRERAAPSVNRSVLPVLRARAVMNRIEARADRPPVEARVGAMKASRQPHASRAWRPLQRRLPPAGAGRRRTRRADAARHSVRDLRPHPRSHPPAQG